LKKIELHDDML